MAGIPLSDVGKAKLYVINGKLTLRRTTPGNFRNIAPYAQKLKEAAPRCAADSRGKGKGAYKSCMRQALSR